MRIGVYDPYLDDLGGGEKYMMTIASCLSQDNNVDIFWNVPENIARITNRFSIDLTKTKVVNNIFSADVSTIKRYFATKKYDAIFILSDGSIPVVGAKKLFIHIQQPLQSLHTTSLLGRVKASRVALFFCNSLYTKSFLEKKFDIHPVVVYPPVEFALSKQANYKKENIILHVGRFRSVNGADYKKQSVMIGAFKKMVDNGFKDWKFIVAVSVNTKDVELFEKMKKTAAGYPIEFVVNQRNKTLWEYYGKAKIYWHASGYGEDLEKHPELAEHFGISTVEAMGAGVVPVVINAGGQKEIVEEGKTGLLWDTLDELEAKTKQLASDQILWKKLSESAQQSAQQFSKEKFCSEIRKLLRS